MISKEERVNRIRKINPDVADVIMLKEPSRIPYIMHGGCPYAQWSSGIKVSEAMLDSELFAKACLNTIKRHDIDGFFPIGSSISKKTLKENELIEKNGAKYLVDPKSKKPILRIAEDGFPERIALVDKNLAMELNEENVKNVYIPTIQEMQEDGLADVIKITAEEVGDKILLGSGASSVDSNVISAIGFDQFLDATFEKQELLEMYLQKESQRVIREAILALRNGCHIVYTTASWSGLLTRETFLKFCYKYHQLLIEEVHKQGGIVLFFASGVQSHLMDLHVDMKPDILLIDQDDIGWVKKNFGNKVCLQGNINPTDILKSSLEDIERKIKECIRKVGYGGGYIFDSSDELARDTPPPKVDIAIKTLRKFGKYPLQV